MATMIKRELSSFYQNEVGSIKIIRTFDLFFCSAALLLLLPLFLIAALAVKISGEGPVLFIQRRIGRHGRSFMCLKFRTMVIDADDRLRRLLATDPDARAEWARDQKLRRDPRVTWIGRFLREFSLDELPQLFNVIAGHMSLVGPRPIVASEAERYGNQYWTYCMVRPGITGIWQISGRNDVNYRRRIAMDVMFVQKLSLKLYLSILINTPPALILRRGAY